MKVEFLGGVRTVRDSATLRGLIAKLVKEGFQGKVVCTKATLALYEVMPRDSGHMMNQRASMKIQSQRSSSLAAGCVILEESSMI